MSSLERKSPSSGGSEFSSFSHAAQYVASRILSLSSERGIAKVLAHMRQRGISLTGAYTILNASVPFGGVKPQSTASMNILPLHPSVRQGKTNLARAAKPRKVRKISTCTRPSSSSSSKGEKENMALTRLKKQSNIISLPFPRISGA